MSYDKPIGFGHHDPKKPLTLSPQDIGWIRKFGVVPVVQAVKKLLTEESTEPEPKLLLKRAIDFNKIRNLLQRAPNSFMIPGQLYTDDHPLVSLLLDTKKHNIPICDILSGDHSLRWRANINNNGVFHQPDFNEKSSAKTSPEIGGCVDRVEREHEFPEHFTNEYGYRLFLEKYREKENRAFCDEIPFSQIHVYAGYMTARTMYGFAVKHPRYNFMVVFEACEDHTQTFAQDMHTTSSYKEFEFEPKQVIGDVPKFARDPEAFKLMLYSFMSAIQNHICANINGAELNFKSKADMAREQLSNHAILDDHLVRTLGLVQRFANHANLGASGEIDLIPERSALYLGESLDDTINQKYKELGHMAAKLLREKRPEQGFIGPSEEWISVGGGMSQVAASSVLPQPSLACVVH